MMPMQCCRSLVAVLLSCFVLIGFPALSRAQTVTIQGIADRTVYDDSAAFRVVTNAGFTYEVTLNGAPVPAGVTNTVGVMDYYDLAVRQTQISNGAITNALVRFIVLSSRRGSPERGLIEWFPLPPIPSTAAEMAGVRLSLITPQDYPAGLDIPVVARVEDGAGNVRRVNGWVSAAGFGGSNFRILRGVGHGFLPPAAAGSTVFFAGALQSLQTNKQVNIESSTTWTTVSGTLGNTTWAPNSRIHVTANLTIPAGVTLTIGEGTVVRLNPGVNLTNSGSTIINGTTVQPVVFTPTNRVAPEQRTGAWGGWIMRGGELIATAAIMTGSGAAAGLSFSPGSSHRSEQPLLFAHDSVVRLTNCALINLAGQVGNGYRSIINWDHCLIQRAITCGEYDGGTNIISHSAVIEFPAVDGVYSAAIADADYDGFYTINTTNYFEHSLFGFCKDDAIDSGSGGSGTVVVTNCWVESALHEAMAWSGEGRKTRTYDSVLINCGQGLECGWSTTNSTSLVSPICLGERLLSTGNSIGARYGDNYTGTSGLGNKAGFLTVTNSIIIHNYRDVFGRAWDNTWNYRSNWMDIRSNYLTAPNTYHPSNAIWNAGTDATRLAAYMTTPADAPVGIGLALWPEQLSMASLTNGVPVRLSSFTTHQVHVDFTVHEKPGNAGLLASGTLIFAPGETVKKIIVSPATVAGVNAVRVTLDNPVGGEITGDARLYLATSPTGPLPIVTLIPYGAAWKYLDDGSNQGTAWRHPGFNDAGWSNGVAQLGFGDGDEAGGGLIRRTNLSGSIATFYFRKSVSVSNPAQFDGFSLKLLRDDAGIVYFNGTEVLRSPNMPAGEVAYNVFTGGSAPPDNTVDSTNLAYTATLLSNGLNVVACEIHQQASNSSDASFDLELVGIPVPPPEYLQAARFGSEVVLYWGDPAYHLECATNMGGGWQRVTGATSPYVTTSPGPARFYRLRR